VSEDERSYITTAIDYANGPPHLGHALEKIGADAVARYLRLKGERVHFVVGTDEHGLKVLQSAEAAGISPREWVDAVAEQFVAAWKRLSISHDDFIRTTEPRHHRAVAEMIRRMHAAGDLYRGTYAGYYCVGCEGYKREEELTAEPGSDGTTMLRCPVHPTRQITWLEEANWFFRLSRYQSRLLQLLEERPEFVQPEIRRNEIRRVVEDGLDDISVSRSRLPWGVPWPDDAEHTVYVWIDALTNYLSAVGFPDDAYLEHWPADIHVIGKDITRFHCVYWPAMLMSADVELPRTVWAHGFISFDGRKFSKSEGTWVDLDEAMDRHGPEALRYFLLRDVPWNGDGDFSLRRFDARYNAELADDIGNFVNRALSLIERYRDGRIPGHRAASLDGRLAELLVRYRAAMDASLLHHGAAAALEVAHLGNGFVEERAPWAQAKDPGLAAELDATLAALARCVAVLATLLQPFMPGKAEELVRRLGLERVPRLDDVLEVALAERRVERGPVLFPKIRD
jgi:methionyl-tRNA synthetase